MYRHERYSGYLAVCVPSASCVFSLLIVACEFVVKLASSVCDALFLHSTHPTSSRYFSRLRTMFFCLKPIPLRISSTVETFTSLLPASSSPSSTPSVFLPPSHFPHPPPHPAPLRTRRLYHRRKPNSDESLNLVNEFKDFFCFVFFFSSQGAFENCLPFVTRIRYGFCPRLTSKK